jgi:hypothetical protein
MTSIVIQYYVTKYTLVHITGHHSSFVFTVLDTLQLKRNGPTPCIHAALLPDGFDSVCSPPNNVRVNEV